MQGLGINTIRVYNLDPAISHDDCASIFNAAGIYMIIDVNSPLPNESIDAGQPWNSYSSVYLTRIFGIVEAFKNYPNLLGFFGGNEVINDNNSGMLDPPYIRAVTRDLKNYIAKHCSRAIPVGYSAADVRDILVDTSNYMQCSIQGDTNDMSKIDFFGLNSYSWCGGDATFQTAGYDVLTNDFASTTIPVFFSEYGCNAIMPRVWDEVQALYGLPMRSVYSGGIAYQYSQETNNFGLVKINGDGSAKLLTDYDNLQSQLDKLDLTAITATNSSATSQTPVQCSSSLISSKFNQNFTLPVIPPGGQDLIDNGVQGITAGKLNTVTDTNVKQTVQKSDGSTISGLKLNILSNDATNTPGQNGTATTSGATATTSKSVGVANARQQNGVAALVGALALAAWMF
jgi:hypothetical protein